jgi:hypothetical protein
MMQQTQKKGLGLVVHVCVNLTTQEIEIRKIKIGGQSRQNLATPPSQPPSWVWWYTTLIMV